MSKWYQPFGLLLVSAMIGQLTGCTMTKDFFVKHPIPGSTTVASAYTKVKGAVVGKDDKDDKDEKVAKSEAPKKSKNTKAGKSKLKEDGKKSEELAAKSKSKKKATEKTEVAKKDATKKDAAKKEIAKNDSNEIAKAKSKAAKPAKPDKPVTGGDEDLDAFVAKVDATAPNKKARADKSSMDEFDPFDENHHLSKKNVVQVKKDESNDPFEDEFANSKTGAKAIKTASKEVDPFENELETQFAEASAKKEKEEPTTVRKTESFDEDLLVAPEIAEESPKESKSEETELPHKELAHKEKEADANDNEELVAHSALSMCPDAKGELNHLLKSINPDESESLKQGLHRIGQLEGKGKAAAPLLNSTLKHDDPFVRAHSALALIRQGTCNADTIQIVTESLLSRDPNLRSFGTSVLNEMGADANDVLRSLSKHLNDSDPQKRIRAAEVLIQYEEYAMPALQKLLACLKDRNENVRWLAVYSLAELAPESPEAVQALMKAVSDPVPKVRVGAAFALGEIGPYAKRSVMELRKVLSTTDDEELKKVITDSIGHIESPAR